MCADVHDTDLISRCGLLLHVFVWCWRRKEFKLHETTERISQRIQQQYSRDPSLLIKDSLCLDFEACLSWLIYIGGTILLDEARLKMIDVRVGHRRRWAFLKIKKKLNLQPFLNWPIILPILHFLHHYRPPVFTADCAVLAQTRRGVKDKMQQGERDGEKEKFWQRGGGVAIQKATIRPNVEKLRQRQKAQNGITQCRGDWAINYILQEEAQWNAPPPPPTVCSPVFTAVATYSHAESARGGAHTPSTAFLSSSRSSDDHLILNKLSRGSSSSLTPSSLPQNNVCQQVGQRLEMVLDTRDCRGSDRLNSLKQIEPMAKYTFSINVTGLFL